MNSFQLYAHCYLVRGACKSAIFDLFQKRVFWLPDKLGIELLDTVVGGGTFENVCAKTGETIESVNRYAEVLEALDFGSRQQWPTFSEKFHPSLTSNQEKKHAIHRTLRQATLEVSSKCSFKCPSCASPDGWATRLCACSRWDSGADGVQYDTEKVIEQLAMYSCSSVYVFGGDPFLNRDALVGILKACSKWGLKVEVQAPGVGLTPQDWGLLKESEASFVLPVFGAEEATCATVTGTENAYGQFLDCVRTARREEFSRVFAKIILTQATLGQRDAIQRHVEELGLPIVEVDTFVPFNVADNPISDGVRADVMMLFRSRAAHFRVSMEEFFRSAKGHYCWQDSIGITQSGNILPCIAARDHVIGNTQQDSLLDVLREKRNWEFRDYSKDISYPCQECEFRYGCFGCSLMTERVFNNWKGREWNCGYSPLSAEWGPPAMPDENGLA